MNDRLRKIGADAVAPIDDPRPALFLHCAIFLRDQRIVSDETFRLISFDGQESVSEPFEFQLELHGNTSRSQTYSYHFDDVVGRPITVGIQFPAGRAASQDAMSDRFQSVIRGACAGPELSLFNGIVTAFSFEIAGVYRITMKPALSRLALTNRYHIHHNLNVRDAIASVLDRHNILYAVDKLNDAANPATTRIQDWLQAGETDFDFIRRLMGKAHLYYYFIHTGTSHTVVFSNAAVYPPAMADGRALRYTYTGIDQLGVTQWDTVSQFSYQHTLTSSGVQATHARQEAAWERDATAQYEAYHASDSPDVGTLPFNQYKIYQYGCSNEQVRHFARAASDALETAGCQYMGSSYCAHFRASHQFTLTGSLLFQTRPAMVRPSLEGQAFVLTMVKHTASQDGGYSNQFQATEAHGFIAAFSMQETQQGSLLARVVGPPGMAPPSDWAYYAEAIPYDVERNDMIDTLASPTTLSAAGVHVRFSTEAEDSEPVWVKLSPSMQTVPELGATVVVSRAQDESELPEIQQTIQANGSNCIMPSAWSASSRSGSNYSTSYGDGKSIRYGLQSTVDLARARGMVEATYDSGRYRETSYAQGASYSFSAADSVAAGSVSDQHELFGALGVAGDIISASESFGSTYHRQKATVTSSVSTTATSYNKSTTGSSTVVSQTDSHDGTNTTGTSTSRDTIGTTSVTQAVGTSSHASVTGSSTSMAATGTSTGVSATGISNNASAVGIENRASAVGVSNSASVIGVTNSASATGVSNGASVVGVHNNASAVGVSNSASATGISNSTSATGVSSSNSVTGAHSAINITGTSSVHNINGFGLTTTMEPGKMKIETNGIDVAIVTITIYL